MSPDRANPRHNAHIATSVRIHYPFHPLAGRDLELAEPPRHGQCGEWFTCRLPDSTHAKIPRWMCRPEAAAVGRVDDQPRCSVGALQELLDLIETFGSKSDCQTTRGNVAPGGRHEAKGVRVCNPQPARVGPATPFDQEATAAADGSAAGAGLARAKGGRR